MNLTPPTIDDIRTAATRIDGAVIKTPTLCSGCHQTQRKHEPLGECSLCHSARSGL